MKHILIFSNHNFKNPSGAAYSRMLNYAKAIVLIKNIKVIFCSFKHSKNLTNLTKIDENIYYCGEHVEVINTKLMIKLFYPIHTLVYLKRVNNLLKILTGEIVVLVFSMKLFFDIFLLLKFKFVRHINIYVEKNELLHSINHSKVYIPTIKRIALNFYLHTMYFIKFINDVLIYFYDGVIVISSAIEEWVKPYNKNIIRIPILTDIEQFHPIKNTYHNTKNFFVVGYTGTISNKKDGIFLLTKAIENISKQRLNIKLNLYGPGSKHEIHNLKRYIKDNNIDYIFYKGNYNYKDLIKELYHHNLLILPRPYSKQAKYGFSTKLADYLACGVPTLATNISDNYLFIKHNYNGFLINVDDLPKLSDIIIEIMRKDNLTYIGQNGRKTAEEYFDYRNYSKKITGFLK